MSTMEGCEHITHTIKTFGNNKQRINAKSQRKHSTIKGLLHKTSSSDNMSGKNKDSIIDGSINELHAIAKSMSEAALSIENDDRADCIVTDAYKYYIMFIEDACT